MSSSSDPPRARALPRWVVATYLIVVVGLFAAGHFWSSSLTGVALLVLVGGFVGSMVRTGLAAAPEALPDSPAVEQRDGPPIPATIKAALVCMILMVLVRAIAGTLAGSMSSLVSAVVMIGVLINVTSRKVSALRLASFAGFGTFAFHLLLLIPVFALAFDSKVTDVPWLQLFWVDGLYLGLALSTFGLLETRSAKEYCCF